MNKIACPKCGRQYQINANLAGKTVKCANCSQSFVVGQTGRPPAATTAPEQRPPSRPAELPSQELGSLSKLFPNQLPQGPDPLANHVVDDPGFMEVNVDQIREQRELEAQKNNKLVDAFSSSSSIDDLDEQKKRKAGPPNQSYLGSDTLFGFEGRINRKKYWLSNLLFGILFGAGLIFAIAGYVLYLQFGLGLRPDENLDIIYLIPLYGIILGAGVLNSWVAIALCVKRYHDLGHPGTRVLFGLIPIVGPIIIFIECGLKPGTKGRNKYGPDPLMIPPKPAPQPSK